MVCGVCGNAEARHVKASYEDGVATNEGCEMCGGFGEAAARFRDAAGNVVSWDKTTPYDSYAVGAVITSQKQFSEELKKQNLVQKGTHHGSKQ